VSTMLNTALIPEAFEAGEGRRKYRVPAGGYHKPLEWLLALLRETDRTFLEFVAESEGLVCCTIIDDQGGPTPMPVMRTRIRVWADHLGMGGLPLGTPIFIHRDDLRAEKKLRASVLSELNRTDERELNGMLVAYGITVGDDGRYWPKSAKVKNLYPHVLASRRRSLQMVA
jgi:hypothetical protein